MTLKYYANLLTLLRIVLSLLLIPLRETVAAFIVVYLLCGLTDILDGFIARKTGTQSAFGARLDSAADLVMFMVIFILILLWESEHPMAVLLPLAIVFVLRMMNLVVSIVWHKKLLFIHTIANKITGAVVFAAPLGFALVHSPVIVWVVSIIAMLSSVEEGLILLMSKEPNLNRKTILIKDNC